MLERQDDTCTYVVWFRSFLSISQSHQSMLRALIVSETHCDKGETLLNDLGLFWHVGSLLMAARNHFPWLLHISGLPVRTLLCKSKLSWVFQAINVPTCSYFSGIPIWHLFLLQYSYFTPFSFGCKLLIFQEILFHSYFLCGIPIFHYPSRILTLLPFSLQNSYLCHFTNGDYSPFPAIFVELPSIFSE